MIFSQIERLETRPAKYAESFFSFLEMSGTSDAGRVRDKMEEWLLDYPADERSNLTARLQSSNDSAFLSAYFEFYIYTLLYRLECSLDIHPDMLASIKKPDFLVRKTDELGAYVEVVLASEATQKETNKTVVMNQVYDILNEIDSPDFFIHLEISGTPETSPQVSRIKNEVSKWLKSLDFNVIADLYIHGGIQGLRKHQLEINHERWKIIFRPIAKSPAIRGKPGIRLIGSQMTGFRMVKVENAIRDAIRKKATRYGKMDRPYIIAINVISPFFDREDVEYALFGYGGMWSASKNTRVSGILITKSLTPWEIAIRDVTLYHNPWARQPYTGPMTKLPQVFRENDQMVFKPGIHPRELFSLEMNWPEYKQWAL